MGPGAADESCKLRFRAFVDKPAEDFQSPVYEGDHILGN